MAVKIILDAGHGGFDNGASYMGRAEKDDALRLALAVGEKLEQDGYDVCFTRTTDVYQSPYEKAELANQSQGQYLISFHRNSGVEDNLYRGVQSLIYEENETVSRIADNINAQMEKIGFRNLGTEEIPALTILRETSMPAVLLEAGFIREVSYPDWLANVVVVPKKEGKWRVCVDYTNLNNACPKDSFPLTRIDQIVDSTSGQGMLSFLDAFSGYHQIPMY